MLTPEELQSLECLIQRARAAAADGLATAAEPIHPGDVVQIRPGCDQTWESSLVLVMSSDNHRIRGQVLRPRRSGCREAWATYKRGEVLRVGRAVYPEPPTEVKSQCYDPACDRALRKPPGREAEPVTLELVRAAGEEYRAKFEASRADRMREMIEASKLPADPKGRKK